MDACLRWLSLFFWHREGVTYHHTRCSSYLSHLLRDFLISGQIFTTATPTQSLSGDSFTCSRLADLSKIHFSRLWMCWLEVDGLLRLVDSFPRGENNLEAEKHILCSTSWRKLKEIGWSLLSLWTKNYYSPWHVSFSCSSWIELPNKWTKYVIKSSLCFRNHRISLSSADFGHFLTDRQWTGKIGLWKQES